MDYFISSICVTINHSKRSITVYSVQKMKTDCIKQNEFRDIQAYTIVNYTFIRQCLMKVYYTGIMILVWHINQVSQGFTQKFNDNIFSLNDKSCCGKDLFKSILRINYFLSMSQTTIRRSPIIFESVLTCYTYCIYD